MKWNWIENCRTKKHERWTSEQPLATIVTILFSVTAAFEQSSVILSCLPSCIALYSGWMLKRLQAKVQFDSCRSWRCIFILIFNSDMVSLFFFIFFLFWFFSYSERFFFETRCERATERPVNSLCPAQQWCQSKKGSRAAPPTKVTLMHWSQKAEGARADHSTEEWENELEDHQCRTAPWWRGWSWHGQRQLLF